MSKLILFIAIVATVAAYAKDSICVSDYDTLENDPASGCYVQSGTWVPGIPVECELRNKACLPVSCTANGLQAKFRADLFDVESDEALYRRLINHTTVLKHGDRKLEYHGVCGYSFVPKDGRLFVTIDWKYGECDFDLNLVEDADGECKEQIHYSVSLSVEHYDGSKMIEFAIDTDVTATCSYCSSITMQSDGFITNQEDTIVNTPGLGKFDELFTCRFYTDPKFQNEILSHDLVNMGTTVYGRVETDSNRDIGLSYYIDYLVVLNDEDSRTFNVVQDGGWADILDARVRGKWKNAFNRNTNFQYRSFGFDDYQNQHYLSVTCSIKLCLSDDDTCDPASCDQTIDGHSYTCPK